MRMLREVISRSQRNYKVKDHDKRSKLQNKSNLAETKTGHKTGLRIFKQYKKKCFSIQT